MGSLNLESAQNHAENVSSDSYPWDLYWEAELLRSHVNLACRMLSLARLYNKKELLQKARVMLPERLSHFHRVATQTKSELEKKRSLSYEDERVKKTLEILLKYEARATEFLLEGKESDSSFTVWASNLRSLAEFIHDYAHWWK